MTFLIKDNGNEGLFDEKENREPKLKHTSHSLDVLIVTAIVVVVMLWVSYVVGGGWWSIPLVVLALVVSNYHMYKAAYRDGFRGGYRQAMDDHLDLGFVPSEY